MLSDEIRKEYLKFVRFKPSKLDSENFMKYFLPKIEQQESLIKEMLDYVKWIDKIICQNCHQRSSQGIVCEFTEQCKTKSSGIKIIQKAKERL